MRHRKIEVARGVWGLVAVGAPRLMLSRTGGDPDDQPSRVVMRVLGARQLAQAALSGVSPTAPVLALGVWVDAVHALSGVGLAAYNHRYARPALTDATVAAGWASAGLRDLNGPSYGEGEERRSGLARWVLGVAPGGHALLRKARQRAM